MSALLCDLAGLPSAKRVVLLIQLFRDMDFSEPSPREQVIASVAACHFLISRLPLKREREKLRVR